MGQAIGGGKKGLQRQGNRCYVTTEWPLVFSAWVAELVDARDLKSLGALTPYEFDSRPRHQISSILAPPLLLTVTPQGFGLFESLKAFLIVCISSLPIFIFSCDLVDCNGFVAV